MLRGKLDEWLKIGGRVGELNGFRLSRERDQKRRSYFSRLGTQTVLGVKLYIFSDVILQGIEKTGAGNGI